MNRRQKMSMLIVGVILAVWLFWVFKRRQQQQTSTYREISTGSEESPNMFNLQKSTACVPGSSPESAYYTTDSISGQGLCGDQMYVHRLGHEYQISEGVGGPLLSSM